MSKDIKSVKRKIEKIFAEEPRKLFNYKQIAAKLDMESSKGRDEIILALKLLEKEQVIEEMQPGKYAAKFKQEFITGKIEITQRGSAYVVPDNIEAGEDNDIFISSDFINTALDKDKVKVHLFPAKSNGKRAGEVVEVLERYKTNFVGVIQLNFNSAFVVADDKKMYTDIFIPKDKTGQAKNGDKVIAKITHWTPDEKSPTGEITEVLGKPGVHETEMNAIVAEFGFATKFPVDLKY